MWGLILLHLSSLEQPEGSFPGWPQACSGMSAMWERVSAHRESSGGRVDAYCGHSTQGQPANQPWHAVWGTGIPWDVAEAKTPLIDLRRGWGCCTTNKLLTSISENANLGFQHHHLLGIFEKHRLSDSTLDLKNQKFWEGKRQSGKKPGLWGAKGEVTYDC